MSVKSVLIVSVILLVAVASIFLYLQYKQASLEGEKVTRGAEAVKDMQSKGASWVKEYTSNYKFNPQTREGAEISQTDPNQVWVYGRVKTLDYDGSSGNIEVTINGASQTYEITSDTKFQRSDKQEMTIEPIRHTDIPTDKVIFISITKDTAPGMTGYKAINIIEI